MKKGIVFLLLTFVCSMFFVTDLAAQRIVEGLSLYKFRFQNTKGEQLCITTPFSGLYNITKQKVVIPSNYEITGLSMISDNYGYCCVKNSNDRSGVIDTDGKLVIPFKYSRYIYPLPNRLFFVQNDKGKEGVIDVNERIVCPIGKYEHLYLQGSLKKRIKANKIFLCAKKTRNGKVGLVDVAGTPVTDFVYDWIDFPSSDDGKYVNTLATITYKDYEYFVDYNWDVIRIENKFTGRSIADSNQNTSRNTNNSRSSSNSSLKAAAAIGVFVGLAACIIDAISSSSSSSSSSYSSSSSSSSRSSYSSSSSSRSKSVCSECTGRGMKNCPWCYGRGIQSGLFSSDKTCHWCKGKGQIWCYHCSGRGSR